MTESRSQATNRASVFSLYKAFLKMPNKASRNCTGIMHPTPKKASGTGWQVRKAQQEKLFARQPVSREDYTGQAASRWAVCNVFMIGDGIMDFFDGWCTFKTTPEGKIIYYPNGFWGKGFVVPNLKKKKGIQRATKRLYIGLLTLFATFIAGTWISTRLVPFGWLWYVGIIFIGLTLGAGVWLQRSIKNLANGLPESEIKLPWREGFSISIRSFGFTFLLFLEIVSGWAVYVGLQMVNRDLGFWFVKAFGIGSVIFGILLGIITTHMIILKTKIHNSK